MEITKDNLFLDPEKYENSVNKYDRGLLDSHSKVMFHPTDSNLYSQCFNLNNFLAAFILVRLVYYRDHTPSYTFNTNELPVDFTEEELEKFKIKNTEIMNFIIEGFWIEVNIDCMDQTPEQKAHFKEAMRLFADNWHNFWF